MKTMRVLVLLALVTSSCIDDSLDASLNTHMCYEGTVIGKIRSWGGGVAVSMESSALSTHEWRGFQHVIEALNIPGEFWTPGQKLYFSGRPGTDEERAFYGSADGDESAKPIIFVTAFSIEGCPEDESITP